MNNKIVNKVIAVVSLLICFVITFGEGAAAYEFLGENIFGVFQEINPDLSSTSGKLNIISTQVIFEGEELQMKFEVSNSGTTIPVKWSSSNPNIISCTEGGKIKGVTKGEAIITVKAKNGNSSDSIKVYCAKKFNKPETAEIRFPIFWVNKTPFFLILKKSGLILVFCF